MRRALVSRTMLGFLIALAVVNLAAFIVQREWLVPISIPSSSMEPTIHAGDRIFVRRTHRSARQLARSIDRGDVIVVRAPEQGHPLVVKRVVALPGETVQAVDGTIAIDDTRQLNESYLPDASKNAANRRSVDIERVELSKSEFFVLGDNRARSIDSRSYGPVQVGDVIGTVSLRFWPPARFGTVRGA